MYVDGFNLYHGLRAKHGRSYLWLDLRGVGTRLLRDGQKLVGVRYFTAAVRNDRPAQQRQHLYLQALRAHGGIDFTLGRFQEKSITCRSCGRSVRSYEEKETDVSIAAALIADGVEDVFDVAILLSADSDLCPAVRTLKRLCPSKRVIAVFPPKRRSEDLRRSADASFTLGDAIIRQCQLPRLVRGGAVTFRRPDNWR
jgi:uncharacterized LabA/DUF88 family protein